MNRNLKQCRAALGGLCLIAALIATGCASETKPATPPAASGTVAPTTNPQANTPRGGNRAIQPGMAGVPK